MVSTAGYVIEEMIGAIIFSFALLLMAFLIRLIIFILEGKRTWSVYASFIFMALATYAFYQLDVRIGAIMFLNGILVTTMMFWAVELIFVWRKYKRNG